MMKIRCIFVVVLIMSTVVNFAIAKGGSAAGSYHLSTSLYVTIATVPPPPVIFSFTPAYGNTGTSVTINGSDFTGTSSVDFNGTPTSFTVVNDGKITAPVPFGATSGPIGVHTSFGDGFSPTNFTVDNTVPSAPVLTATSPPSPARSNTPHIIGTSEPKSTVTLFAAVGCSGPPVGVGTADASGNFNISVTVPNNSTTTFYGNATDTAGNVSTCSSQGITYTEDTTLPAGSICGTKFLDVNGNGVFDIVGDVGILGWTIEAISSVGDTLFATTDSSGSYCFNFLGDTLYTVFERQGAGYIQTGGQPFYKVYKNVLSQVNGIDFGDFRTGQISGMKFNDLNGNGTRDTLEQPIANWMICLAPQQLPSSIDLTNISSSMGLTYGANTAVVSLQGFMSDRRGVFQNSLNGIPVEMLQMELKSAAPVTFGANNFDVFVKLQAVPGSPSLLPGLDDRSFGFFNGNGASPANSFFDVFVEVDLVGTGGGQFVNHSAFHINGTANAVPFPVGTVWNGANSALFQIGSNFQVGTIQTFSVTLGQPVSPSAPVRVKTDNAGKYSFLKVLPGTFNITESNLSCWTQSTPPPTPITISSGDSVPGIDFGNHGSGAQICVVTYYDQNHNQQRDIGENTMSGVPVSLAGLIPSNIHSDTTDISGSVCFTGLQPDTYTLTELVPAGYDVSNPKAGFLTFQITGCEDTTVDWGNSAGFTDSTFRTATISQWALSPDQKGKHKSVKAKPDKVDFKFNLLFRAGDLKIKFPMFTTGVMRVGKSKATTAVAQWDSVKQLLYPSSQLSTFASPGDTLQFDGRGFKGKPLTLTYQWTAPTGGVIAKGTLPNKPATVGADTLKLNILRLPMPDLHNVGEDLQFHGAYPIVIGSPPDSHAVTIFKYKDLLKSIVKDSPFGATFHTDSTSCLRNFKVLKALPPGRYNVALFAELLVLKLNILASQRGYFPSGLDSLIYDYSSVEPGHPLNGKSIAQIVVQADSIVTCYGDPKQLHLTPLDYYIVLHRINGAFGSSTLDTVSWGGAQPVFKGVRLLKDVFFLRANPGAIHPAILPYIPVSEYNPMSYRLNQNYPNPFNPTTTIQFELPEPAIVTLKVYNLLGQEVRTLLSEEQMDDGVQEVEFDASALTSGVYFYRIIANGIPDPDAGTVGKQFVSTKKMLLIK